jgi:hypothetical protein
MYDDPHAALFWSGFALAMVIAFTFTVPMWKAGVKHARDEGTGTGFIKPGLICFAPGGTLAPDGAR